MQDQISEYIKTWESRCYYSDGLPDEVPNEISSMVPSYKRIAQAILKNDHALKSLGFTPKKSMWYNELKRIELTERGIIKPSKQLKLKL